VKKQNESLSLERLVAPLRKKPLKKGCSEKHRTKNLALVDLMLTKKHLTIKNLLVIKNHLEIKNSTIKKLSTEKQLIENRLLSVNRLKKLLPKNRLRSEHIDPTRKQLLQNAKHAFKRITDFA
jgi:hypothetical protein